MAHKANDGSEWTNRMMADRRNRSLSAKADDVATQTTGDDPGDDAPVSIEQDPEAMQAVELLKDKGYTADDVAQAMNDLGGDDDAQQQQSHGGSAAPAAGLTSIPGLSQ